MKASESQHLLGIACVFFAALVWGTTGTAATFAPEVSPIAIGAAAMGIGGLLQALIASKRIMQSTQQLAKQWHYVVLGGIAVAIYPLAFYASMRMAGVTVGTVISIGSAPLLAALIEYCLDGLRLTKRWWFGAALGLLGMLLLTYADNGSSVEKPINTWTGWGVLLGLVAGLTYAFYSWCARRLMQGGLFSTAAMGAIFGVGGCLLMPILIITGGPFLNSWNNALVGMYMALIPMFLGYIFFGYGLARIQASTATTITLFEPVVAAFLAVVIVGERLLTLGWVGVALIIACLLCITAPTKR